MTSSAKVKSPNIEAQMSPNLLLFAVAGILVGIGARLFFNT